MKIPEKDAVRALVQFVREDADLDVLAEMLSDWVLDNYVCIVGENGAQSDTYLNGLRTKATKTCTKTNRAKSTPKKRATR